MQGKVVLLCSPVIDGAYVCNIVVQLKSLTWCGSFQVSVDLGNFGICYRFQSFFYHTTGLLAACILFCANFLRFFSRSHTRQPLSLAGCEAPHLTHLSTIESMIVPMSCCGPLNHYWHKLQGVCMAFYGQISALEASRWVWDIESDSTLSASLKLHCRCLGQLIICKDKQKYLSGRTKGTKTLKLTIPLSVNHSLTSSSSHMGTSQLY